MTADPTSGRVRSLRQRVVQATWGGRDAHGAVPFRDKHVWLNGYDTARQKILDALAAIEKEAEEPDQSGRVRSSDEALTLLAHWLRSVLVDDERTLLDRMNEVVGYDEVDEVLRHARPLSSPGAYSEADLARLMSPASTPSTERP